MSQSLESQQMSQAWLSVLARRHIGASQVITIYHVCFFWRNDSISDSLHDVTPSSTRHCPFPARCTAVSVGFTPICFMFCAIHTHIICSVLFCHIQSTMFSFSARSTLSHTSGTASPGEPLKNYPGRSALLNTL